MPKGTTPLGTNKSPHVAVAAVGEAAGSADLRPSAATAAAAGHNLTVAPSPPIAAEAARSRQTNVRPFSSSGQSNDIEFEDMMLSNAS